MYSNNQILITNYIVIPPPWGWDRPDGRLLSEESALAEDLGVAKWGADRPPLPFGRHPHLEKEVLTIFMDTPMKGELT